VTARFTIELVLRDRHGEQRPLMRAIDVDEAMRISSRAVGEMKLGVGSLAQTVEMMRVREFRRDFLVEAARGLAAEMADLMADAEGWHDASRVEPARRALGGEWRD
jgi:hypothetical protein